MIFFDVTKTGAAGHRSGLTRVSMRLREELGSAATSVAWDGDWRLAGTRTRITPKSGDWLATAELFSEAERPGFSAWLAARPCRVAGIFHDAIPLRHPHITWPQSVARHPSYMKLLAQFDRMWAVSAASRDELAGFWQWQRVEHRPSVDILPLGADFNRQARVTAPSPAASPAPALLCVGIIEPRKNQSFLLDVCAQLWTEGLAFDLHLVGRVNPHFGAPIVAQMRAAQKRFGARLHFHEAASDATLAELHRTASALALPTIAEGCGLPLLEALWLGVPCICSDLPSMRENAAAGGCVLLPVGDRAAWVSRLRRFLTMPGERENLALAARQRPLPTWAAAARVLRSALD